MQKTLTVAVVAALMTVSFTACGADVPETQAPATSHLENSIDTVTNTQKVERDPIEFASDARITPVVKAAREVGPAVVGITNKAVARDWYNNQVQYEQGVGSGVIFSADGYIVTNNHVIAGASEIVVSLPDGRNYAGTLVGTDELTDLAVVKIEAENLPAAVFADSSDLMVGEPAIAIGNPMGLELKGSVTAGVVSALNRTLSASDSTVQLIQTDAAINPGNSGGALVNAEAKVIGINSAKIATSGIEGIGFAIPSNTVRDIVNELLANGRVIRPYLGVSIFDKESAARQGYRLNAPKGVYVAEFSANGPAANAGIREGDLILSLDGKETNTLSSLRKVILSHKPGDVIKGVILRNNQELSLDIQLEAFY